MSDCERQAPSASRPKCANALLVVAVLVTATTLSAPAVASVADGKRLAETLCAECHLNEGQGEKHGAMGIPGFRAVANRPNQTYEHIVDWLKSIPVKMPNHHLTQDEMSDLADFIMSLRREP